MTNAYNHDNYPFTLQAYYIPLSHVKSMARRAESKPVTAIRKLCPEIAAITSETRHIITQGKGCTVEFPSTSNLEIQWRQSVLTLLTRNPKERCPHPLRFESTLYVEMTEDDVALFNWRMQAKQKPILSPLFSYLQEDSDGTRIPSERPSSPTLSNATTLVGSSPPGEESDSHSTACSETIYNHSDAGDAISARYHGVNIHRVSISHAYAQSPQHQLFPSCDRCGQRVAVQDLSNHFEEIHGIVSTVSKRKQGAGRRLSSA
jgi:hypothetical protein